MRRASRKQQNVPGLHGNALAIGKIYPALSGEHDVIGRPAQGFLRMLASPIPLELAAQIQAAANIGQADEFID
ncbi:hypothetical protein D3C71_1147900 [compost metagenome]